MITTTERPQPKQSRTERAQREIARWRADKRKGKLILHFDGSGEVAKLEESRFI